MLAAVLIFVFLVGVFLWADRRHEQMVKEEIKALESQPASPLDIIRDSDLEPLPEPVQHWLHKAGVMGKEPIRKWQLRQRARIRLHPNQTSWSYLTARQFFITDPPGFIWKARTYMLGILPVKVRDKLIDGKGEMLVKVLGLFTIARARGPKIDEGALQRYLAEIVWLPTAALSAHIDWEPIDSHAAKAHFQVGNTRVSGIFHFNEAGEVQQFQTMRYRGNDPQAEREPWVIDVQKTDMHHGFRIPVAVTITWKLKERDWTWMKLEVLGDGEG